MTKFLRGTVILLIAGFITRMLGFINRIVIARFIGEEGVGLYMMVFPTLMLIISITQLGLPIAISKFVAEAEAKKDQEEVNRIIVITTITSLGLSLILTPALMIFAKPITLWLFTDDRTYLPLLAISPIIPIVALSAVLRGVFIGKQMMKPVAVSQVLEQIVRIGFIILITSYFLPFGIEYAAAAAMLAAVLGELVSLLFLIKSFKLGNFLTIFLKTRLYLKTGRQTAQDLLSIALPALGSRMIGSIAWFFEPIIVTKSLALAGVTTVLATKQYGSLTGFALPLLMLPSFITHSLASALIPALSEAYSQGNETLIRFRLLQVLRFVIISGTICLIILYVLAEQTLALMYNSTSGVIFIKIMAPLFLFSYVQAPLQATLQALNLATSAMLNTFIGAICKLSIIFLLTSQPQFGIIGTALGIMSSVVLVTILHLATVYKRIPFTVSFKNLFKLILTTGLTGGAGIFFLNNFTSKLPTLLTVLSAATIMLLVYLGFLFIFKLVRREDFRFFKSLLDFIN